MNEHPPIGHFVHRMGYIFSIGSKPYVNQHCTTTNLFWLLTFDVYLGAIYFPTSTSIQPSHQAILLTYILALPNNQPLLTYLLLYCYVVSFFWIINELKCKVILKINIVNCQKLLGTKACI
jgi:hypothetical protein